jgi:hypothetical protein
VDSQDAWVFISPLVQEKKKKKKKKRKRESDDQPEDSEKEGGKEGTGPMWESQAALAAALLNFTPGRPRCDNRVAEVLAGDLGLALANPALSLRTYHVHSGMSPAATAAAPGSSPDNPEVKGGGGGTGEASPVIGGYQGATQVPGAVRNVPISLESFRWCGV